MILFTSGTHKKETEQIVIEEDVMISGTQTVSVEDNRLTTEKLIGELNEIADDEGMIHIQNKADVSIQYIHFHSAQASNEALTHPLINAHSGVLSLTTVRFSSILLNNCPLIVIFCRIVK